MTMLSSMSFPGVLFGPRYWVSRWRALSRGVRVWSRGDRADRARSHSRPNTQDRRSSHPLDDARPDQPRQRQRQLLPETDGQLVLRIGRADVGQLAGLDQVVLIGERHLVHAP